MSFSYRNPVFTLLLLSALMFLLVYRQSDIFTNYLVIKTHSHSNNTRTHNTAMSLLHTTVKRQLINGRLPVNWTNTQTWRIWKNNSQESPCYKYTTRFGVNLPRVWLLSFPCSGNSWTRYLLEAASGIFTGSIYNDSGIYEEGLFGEKVKPDSLKTLVQKTHEYPVSGDLSIPIVLLLRNPKLAFISHFKRLETKSHVKQIPYKLFSSDKFHKRVKPSIEDWVSLALKALLWTEAPVHVMYYERLVQSPLKELRRVLAFLGVPEDEGRMECIASNLEGFFKRKNNKDFDPYTGEEKSEMAGAVKTVNKTLQIMGYAPLPFYK